MTKQLNSSDLDEQKEGLTIRVIVDEDMKLTSINKPFLHLKSKTKRQRYFSSYFDILQPKVICNFQSLKKLQNQIIIIQSKSNKELFSGKFMYEENIKQLKFIGNPLKKTLPSTNLGVKHLNQHENAGDTRPQKNQDNEALDLLKKELEEEKLKNEILLSKNQELVRSNLELLHFASITAHDMRAPLRTISSFAQLVKSRLKQEAAANELKEYFDYVIEGAKDLTEMIDTVLDSSKTNFGGDTGHSEIDLNELLVTVVKNLRVEIEGANALIEVENLPKVKGNRQQIKQVFQNIIQNAVKYRSERKPLVKVKYEAMPDVHKFMIQDNGTGIDINKNMNLFHFLQRGQEHAQIEGTGIGLAICKKIIEEHQGKIWMMSMPEKGSCFIFTLPI